jgi:cysteine desulfurase/selenocysteine lyase
VDGLHPFDVAAVLDRQGVATRVGQHCAEPYGPYGD